MRPFEHYAHVVVYMFVLAGMCNSIGMWMACVRPVEHYVHGLCQDSYDGISKLLSECRMVALKLAKLTPRTFALITHASHRISAS